MEAARMDAKRFPTIIDWFDRLEGMLRQYKIGPRNIYNFDDSGFQVGQGKAQRVGTTYSIS
jgi:hypothetical protein